MALRQPESMDECVYFTRRALGKDGKAVAWVFRESCPKCKKGMMGKPRDEKTGKPKIRAKEYECPECKYTVEKQEYEDSLTCNIEYTCSKCKKSGEAEVPFKRKKVQLLDEETGKKAAVDAVVFQCEHCNEKLVITKKMKGT